MMEKMMLTVRMGSQRPGGEAQHQHVEQEGVDVDVDADDHEESLLLRALVRM
jgi:hypothetical protein